MKKLVLLLCFTINLAASEANSQKALHNTPAGKQKLLDLVTHIKPVHQIILGYIGWHEVDTSHFDDEKACVCDGLAFSPNGRCIAYGVDSEIYIIDTATYTRKHTLQASRVNSVAYSPNGEYIAASCDGIPAVYLWDTQTYNRIFEDKDNNNYDYKRSAQFSPCGTYLFYALGVFGLQSGKFYRYEIATKKIKTISTTDGAISKLRFSPNGRYLAVSLYNDRVKIFDARSLVCLADIATEGFAMTFSPDSRYLITGPWTWPTHHVRFWDSTNNFACAKEVETSDSFMMGLAISANSKFLAYSGKYITEKKDRYGTEKNTVKLLDYATCTIAQVLDHAPDPISKIAFSKNSKLLAYSLASGLLKVWKNQAEEIDTASAD